MVEVNTGNQALSGRMATALNNRTQKTPYEIGKRIGQLTVLLLCGLLLLSVAVAPAAAQEQGEQEQPEGICDTALMGFVKAVTGGITVLGPTLGLANAGWNMSKAASTNKSQKKKEAKENVRSSLMYGIGAGLLMSIAALITTWGPISFC